MEQAAPFRCHDIDLKYFSPCEPTVVREYRKCDVLNEVVKTPNYESVFAHSPGDAGAVTAFDQY
jgi:hypothetical protein